MEAIQSTEPKLSQSAKSIHWSRKAFNYRIPRRGADYMLFSIVADGVLALLTAVALLSGLSLMPTTMLNIPAGLFIIEVLAARLIIFHLLGIYSSEEQPRFIREVFSVMVATVVSVISLLGVLYLTQTPLTFGAITMLAVMAITVHVGWRTGNYIWSYYSAVRRILAPRHVLIIGATEIGRELADIINHFPLPTTRVVGYLDNNLVGKFNDLPIIGSFNDDIFKIIRQYDVDEILLTTTRHVARDHSPAIINLQYVPVNVRLVPNYLKLNFYSTQADSLDELPLIMLRKPAIPTPTRIVKRAMDITLASIALMLTLPMFGLIALLIYSYDRAPIFFKQSRYGENGKLFEMLKFRSMIVNADQLVDQTKITDDAGVTIYKRKDDERITPIGRLIRKTSLDELPQLINIIRGDMSIVGPRPEVVKIVEKEYEPWQYERLSVPQGLTGWWQVTGRSEKECYRDTEKDIYYVRHHSLWLDIKIILMTIPALLKGKGAF